jgi:hypothetical protein
LLRNVSAVRLSAIKLPSHGGLGQMHCHGPYRRCLRGDRSSFSEFCGRAFPLI